MHLLKSKLDFNYIFCYTKYEIINIDSLLYFLYGNWLKSRYTGTAENDDNM